ncbi:BppU family phage baseplate upper protein [Mammaliicoccus sp. N-M51]|uniref:BppU family phage baseplate upper protein n=1 Tax=Mammaliicoccus sp. N-M51 TaxID=2898710 RepID=UPI001EFBDF71|nr:BppU family phage baseplate upper protein [Mammaliicoccus sp. N-M51]
MAIYKNKDIEVNVNGKSADVGFIDTNFYTEDISTSSIRITIKNNKRAVDLNKTNLTPKLDLFHSDGSIFMDKKINLVLPEQGIIQYKISDKVIKHPGKVSAKLFLKNETQSVHVANFNFTIKDSGITEAVSKEVTINLVDETIRKIIREDAMELLGENFENNLNESVLSHLESNADLFKGPKGDKGDVGPQGPQGIKGDTGTSVVDKGWIEITLLNEITGSSSSKPVYKIVEIDSVKFLFLSGAINNAKAGTTTIIGKIPNIKLPAICYINSSKEGVVFTLDKEGNLKVFPPTSHVQSSFLGFSGTLFL